MDVHVIGAGPAGSVAAISAHRRGYRVRLSEEHPQAGVPTHCSGLFSKDGLERLRDYADYRPLVINPIHGAVLHIAGVRMDVDCPQPIAFVCDRAGLDQTLAAQAAAEGVSVEYRRRVQGRFDADAVIGADGPFSGVARHFNFPRISTYASTVQARIPYRCEDTRRVEVYIDSEQFPGFFGWVIPHSERLAEFGVGVLPPHSVGRAWRALLHLKGVRHSSAPAGAAIPLNVRSRTGIARGRYTVCLVGDAAGQTKNTTGGGVIFGSQCAMLAGRYAAAPWKYEMGWRLRHGPDLAFHRFIHRHLFSRPNPELRWMARMLHRLRCDEYLSRHGHMDRPLEMMNLNLLGHVLSLPFRSL